MKRYDWTADQQIYLISAYFIGYIITNLFGGVLAERFGATKTISLILVLTAASFATIPKISTFGYYPLFALRIVQGCIEVRQSPRGSDIFRISCLLTPCQLF